MRYTINRDNPCFPFLMADNWYSPEEEIIVFKELDYFNSTETYENAKENCAFDEKNNKKANNHRLYYDKVFHDKKYSFINQRLDRIQKPEFHNLITKAMPIGRVFHETNWDNTLINYYEDKQGYKSHYDTSTFTMLIFFYKQPKKFEGGDLWSEDSNITVECKHNRMVIFPGYYLHQVNEVTMNNEDKNKGLGRYSITHFISRTPETI